MSSAICPVAEKVEMVVLAAAQDVLTIAAICLVTVGRMEEMAGLLPLRVDILMWEELVRALLPANLGALAETYIQAVVVAADYGVQPIALEAMVAEVPGEVPRLTDNLVRQIPGAVVVAQIPKRILMEDIRVLVVLGL